MTAAGGLAMLSRGKRPHELLHFVYAVLAVTLVPVADQLGANWTSKKKALARLAGAFVALGVIIRLFAAG